MASHSISQQIKNIVLAVIFFFDSSIKEILSFLFIPQRNSSLDGGISGSNNKPSNVASIFTISSTTSENNHNKLQKDHVNEVKHTIFSTLIQSEESWNATWNNNLSIPVCVLLSLYHFVVSRNHFLFRIFVPKFVSNFWAAALVYFMATFSISFEDAQLLDEQTQQEQKKEQNQQQQQQQQLNEEDKNKSSSRGDKQQQQTAPGGVVVRCNKSYGLFLYVGTEVSDDDEDENGNGEKETRNENESQTNKCVRDDDFSITTATTTKHEKSGEASGSNLLPDSATPLRRSDTMEDPVLQHDEAENIISSPNPGSPALQAPLEQEDSTEENKSNSNNNGKKTKKNAKAPPASRKPSTMAPSHGDDNHHVVPNRERPTESPQPARLVDSHTDEDENNHSGKLRSFRREQQQQNQENNKDDDNEEQNEEIRGKLNNEDENTVETQKHQDDGENHVEGVPTPTGNKNRSNNNSSTARNEDESPKNLASTTSPDKLSFSDSKKSGIKQDQSSPQNVTTATTEKMTYIWIDATAARSAIPQWWTLFWKKQASNNNKSKKNNNNIRHCQLVHLTESTESEDCAHMVSPDSAITRNSSPITIPSSTGLFPSVTSSNSKNNKNSSSSRSSSGNNPQPRLVSGQDSIEVNKKRMENSSRVLTEALAEGVVSAWSLVAQGRLDVLDKKHSEEVKKMMKRSHSSSSESLVSSKTVTPSNQSHEQQQQQSKSNFVPTSVSAAGEAIFANREKQQNSNSNSKARVVRQKICFVTTGYEGAAALLLAATSTSEEMRNSFAGCIFFDALKEFPDGSADSVSREFHSTNTNNNNHNNGSSNGKSQSSSSRFSSFLPFGNGSGHNKNEAVFSSLGKTRDLTLLEEMWRRMMKTGVHHHHLHHHNDADQDQVQNKTQVLGKEQLFVKGDENPLGRIIEGLDLDSSIAEAANAGFNSSTITLNALANNNNNSTLTSRGLQSLSSQNNNYNSSQEILMFSSHNNNNNNGGVGGSPLGSPGIMKKSAIRSPPHHATSSSGFQQKPVVFRVPSVPDWSQLLETISQHSGRNTPSNNGSSARQRSLTPEIDSMNNNFNSNMMMSEASINNNKFAAVGNSNLSQQRQLQPPRQPEGGEQGSSSPTKNSNNNNKKNAFGTKSALKSSASTTIPKSSSDIFAVPSIALKVEEHNMVEAASGVARPNLAKNASSQEFSDDGYGGAYEAYSFYNNNNNNQQQQDSSNADALRLDSGSDDQNSYFHRGDTLNQTSFATTGNPEPASTTSFDSYRVNENDDDSNNNNKSKKSLITSPSKKTTRVLSPKQRMSELAHKTDQFFRNDMRSVAARVQLNHGTFVFINQNNNNSKPSSSEHRQHSSSLNRNSPTTAKKQNNNNNNLVNRDDECNSPFLSISPGTKLIQTWIQRIQAPQLFENLLMSGSSSSHANPVKKLSAATIEKKPAAVDNHDKENNNNNNNNGVNLLFVNLKTTCSTSTSRSSTTSTLPAPQDLVLFIFVFWNYLTKSFGLVRFLDSVYRKIVLDFFWNSFVMKFLVGANEKAFTSKNKHTSEVLSRDGNDEHVHFNQNEPLILNLVENIGKTM